MKNEKNTKESVTPIDTKKSLIKDGFLGWTNIKWFITEVRDIYANKDSYFSKKRIESGIAFAIAQGGMVFFLMEKHSGLTMGEFLLWAAAEFAVSGYMISKIESEKPTSPESDVPPTQ